MENSTVYVKDYMTKVVTHAHPDDSAESVIELMVKTGHDGFPVVDDDNHIIGMITSFDFVLKKWATKVNDLMSTDLIVAGENTEINNASRLMFREGISRLPIVDDDGVLIGIITNTDIVRSLIERTNPKKVETFQSTLEQLYNIKTKVEREIISVNRIRPTQDRVYADELKGRMYEIEKGLAEPIILVHVGTRYVLVDGHHRMIATLQLGFDEIDAYVIELPKDIKLGIEKTADDNDIHTFKDVTILNDDQHPLTALTQSIRNRLNKQKRDKKLKGE